MPYFFARLPGNSKCRPPGAIRPQKHLPHDSRHPSPSVWPSVAMGFLEEAILEFHGVFVERRVLQLSALTGHCFVFFVVAFHDLFFAKGEPCFLLVMN